MVEKTQIKIDDSGRIVLPKLVRNKFSLEKNEYLTLETDEEKIILKKNKVQEKYKNIINKLDYINKKYNLSLIMMDNNEIIYTTEDYKKLLHKKRYKNLTISNKLNYKENTTISKTDILDKEHFYFEITIDPYTKAYLFIITKKDNKPLIELIYNLLK